MKGEVIPENAVRFVRSLAAPPDKVWAFLTETSRLPEWYGEGKIEPREGGAVSLLGGHIRGVVTQWRPEKLLGYTWNVFSPGENASAWPVSYVELALEADGDGAKLTLTQRPIAEPMQKQTMMGWHTWLDLIEAGLKGDFPKRSTLFPKNATLYDVDLDNLKKV